MQINYLAQFQTCKNTLLLQKKICEKVYFYLEFFYNFAIELQQKAKRVF
jgi:hypothetical protein